MFEEARKRHLEILLGQIYGRYTMPIQQPIQRERERERLTPTNISSFLFLIKYESYFIFITDAEIEF